MQRGMFDEVDYGRIEPFRPHVVRLDTAQDKDNPLEVPIAGTFIYVDDDTDGKVYIRFNDDDAARIPVSAGFSASGLLFRRVYLDWEAQSGKTVNIVYGSGVSFTPTNDISNIGSILSPVEPALVSIPSDAQPYFYAGTSAALFTVFTPAQNTNGIEIFYACALGWNGRIMYKSSAPTSWNDPNAFSIADSRSFSTFSPTHNSIRNSGIVIPAGMGLYHQTNDANGPLDVSIVGRLK